MCRFSQQLQVRDTWKMLLNVGMSVQENHQICYDPDVNREDIL